MLGQPGKAQEVEFEAVPTTQLSMAFFDRLSDCGA
jgi:hypothetical protein